MSSHKMEKSTLSSCVHPAIELRLDQTDHQSNAD